MKVEFAGEKSGRWGEERSRVAGETIHLLVKRITTTPKSWSKTLLDWIEIRFTNVVIAGVEGVGERH